MYKLNDSVIVSPTQLSEITKVDFGEEEYFTNTDNNIGYSTNIESGFWILSKPNEIRYNLKNGNKKLAVIQIRENNKYSIDQNVFSYSSKIEKTINEKLNESKNINSVVTKLLHDTDIKEDLSSCQDSLNNKSLKSVINEFDLSMDYLNNNYVDNVSKKISHINEKFSKVLMNLDVETSNMKFNTTKQNIAVNKSLITVNNNKTLKMYKDAINKMSKLFKLNSYESKSQDLKNGGKYE